LATFNSRRRVEGGGRRPVLGELEDTLVDQIFDIGLRKEKVFRDWITAMAHQLFYDSRTEEEHEENPIRFTASDPWVARTNLTTLTDKLQAGDVGIFKSFKDKMSVLINDSVHRNCGWLGLTAWRQVLHEVLMRSVASGGFSDDVDGWHISKHDVYGADFNARWNAVKDQARPDDEIDDVGELNDAFDEIVIDE
ncbi:TPA: hypothetical protein N0F65_000041, partial [Lagenidium giganteum]